MNAIQTLRARRSLLSFGAASLLAMSAATAQVATNKPGDTGIDSSGSYRQEVEACQSGKTQQDRETCLREARNAQDAKKRGALPNTGDYQSNAMARCQVFTGEDRSACEARVMGYGNATGSVAGGGVLREVETVVVPPGQRDVTIEPKTADPVVVVPGAPSGAQPQPPAQMQAPLRPLPPSQ